MSITIKFGSHARGDNDYISDTDILKVINPKDSIQNKSDIHYYTKRRLKLLQKSESLFLVHLREEGQILKDQDDWLKNFLNQVPNFKASEERLKLVKNYLEILLSIDPTNQQKLWWLDCLYVFLRDYLIKQNSQYEIYSFSPNKFAKPINNRVFDLTEVVLQLRHFKSIYRNNLVEIVSNKAISSLKQTLLTALSLREEKNTLLNIFNSNTNLEPYFELRLIEGLYLNEEIIILDNILMKFIQSPHAYNWEIKHTNFKSKVKVL